VFGPVPPFRGLRKNDVLGRLPGNLPTEVILIPYRLSYQCTYINYNISDPTWCPVRWGSLPFRYMLR